MSQNVIRVHVCHWFLSTNIFIVDLSCLRLLRPKFSFTLTFWSSLRHTKKGASPILYNFLVSILGTLEDLPHTSLFSWGWIWWMVEGREYEIGQLHFSVYWLKAYSSFVYVGVKRNILMQQFEVSIHLRNVIKEQVIHEWWNTYYYILHFELN